MKVVIKVIVKLLLKLSFSKLSCFIKVIFFGVNLLLKMLL